MQDSVSHAGSGGHGKRLPASTLCFGQESRSSCSGLLSTVSDHSCPSLNLQSNDAAKLWILPQYMHMLWSGPFQARLPRLQAAASGTGCRVGAEVGECCTGERCYPSAEPAGRPGCAWSPVTASTASTACARPNRLLWSWPCWSASSTWCPPQQLWVSQVRWVCQARVWERWQASHLPGSSASRV